MALFLVSNELRGERLPTIEDVAVASGVAGTSGKWSDKDGIPKVRHDPFRRLDIVESLRPECLT